MPRFTIDVDDKFNDVLTELAKGGSKAEVIRKAIATYQYLKSEVPSMQSDKRVSVTDAEGNILHNVIIP